MWWEGAKTKEPEYKFASPIPLELPSVAGWKEIPVKEGRELLVPLGPFSDHPELFTDSIYFGERTSSSPYAVDPLKDEKPLTGSLLTMFVRESVAKQLKEAQQLLPPGMYLIILDTYRTLEVQQSLFDKYYEELKRQNTEWDEEELLIETQKYVSIPSKNPAKPSPHNTGGSVDAAIFDLPKEVDKKVKEINVKLQLLSSTEWQEAYRLEMERISLIKEHAKLLEFGTPFDYGGREAALNFFEHLSMEKESTKEEIIARDNRRLLFKVMTAVGFEPYEDEWWHYNSKKSQMGAKTSGLPFAEYGAINLSTKNLKHEEMRVLHRLGTVRLQAGWIANPALKVMRPGYAEQYHVARQVATETGDFLVGNFPKAAVIKPPDKN